MNYTNRSFDRIAKEILSRIEEDLMRVGIFYRIFFRCKSELSLEKKLNLTLPDDTPKYDGENKFIRDLIGIRINLYFIDDLEILTSFIKEKYKKYFVEETIDQNTATEFKPTRVNLVFRLFSPYDKEFRELINNNLIDNTFELQIRTVFSEGWHEIEHDLRYKSKDDWNLYPNLSRNFNGLLASLETNEWSMVQMFDRLNYSHYKSNNLSAMIRTKFRLRMDDTIIEDKLLDTILNREEIKREFIKIERIQVIELLLKKQSIYLMSKLNNYIYFINYFFIKDKQINDLIPELLLRDFEK